MRLILITALWLGLSLTVRAEDFVEEAVVTEEETEAKEDIEINYVSPTPKGKVYFAEHFDNLDEFEAKWVRSQAKKDGADEDIAKYDGKWAVEGMIKDGLKGDMGLVLKSKAKHAAIAASLDRPFSFTNKPLIVQYDVTFQNGQECGGAYIKLLTQETGMRLSQFQDKTPYTIMLGPDKCGNDHKLHFIFQHKNPKDGSLSEKHAKKPSARLDEFFKDGKPHLYKLLIQPDNSFEVSVDYKVINKGSLLDDFTPPVNPPAEIDDPEDFKPQDWDEREKIADPDARKPDDWNEEEPEQMVDSSAEKPTGWLDDEPEMIPDPTAEKPDDWDEEMDGTWEAPLISNPVCDSAAGCGEWKAPMKANPNFKGKWRAPFIDNPNYRGKWRARRIPNPDFFEDKNPFAMSSIGAVGIELWSMSDNILFDNILITDDVAVAEEWAADTFDLKMNLIDKEQPWVNTVRRWFNRKSNALMVYGMYLSLPVTLYVWFLRRRVIEEKEENRAREAAAKKTDEAVDDDAADDDEGVEDVNNEIPALEGEEDDAKDDDSGDGDDADDAAEEAAEEPVKEKSSPRRRRAARKD
jgi:calnexin